MDSEFDIKILKLLSRMAVVEREMTELTSLAHEIVTEVIPINISKRHAVIAANLRDFGFPHATQNGVAAVHRAMKRREPVPFGILGRLARDQLEAFEKAERDSKQGSTM